MGKSISSNLYHNIVNLCISKIKKVIWGEPEGGILYFLLNILN